MSFKVVSNARMQQLPEEEIMLRLKNIIHTHSNNIWIRDDLSLFDENKLSPLLRATWMIAKHFEGLKYRFFHINAQQSAQSFRSIEREIAKGIAHQVEIEKLFRQAITIYNLIMPNDPYVFLPLPIHKAILEKNLPKVMHLVIQNKDFLNQINSLGETPLHVSIKTKFDAATNFLLSEHPNPSEKDEISGNTPLHLAVEMDDIELVRIILRKHISPKILNTGGQTPLDIARNLRNRPLIKLLEEYEAYYFNHYFEALVAGE
ncbi:MAG: ankyrin repeat domain-containing protein [Parachlamydiales bacterium]|jgi:hypothetical protein